MRATLAIAGAELRRFVRDRSNIFFAFVFPLLLVLVIGSQFGSGLSVGRVSIAGESGALQRAITAKLEDRGVSVLTGDRSDVLDQVSRGHTGVGLFIPSGANAAYAAARPVSLEVVPSAQTSSLGVRQVVQAAVDAVQLEQAQVSALVQRGLSPDAARQALGSARAAMTAPSVRTQDVDALAQEFSGIGRFDVGAGSMVLLFMFLASLGGSSTLIVARRQGIVARSLAAPISVRQVVLGQGLGRLAIALFQGLYIIVATALLFGVRWGNPLLTALVMLCFGAVSVGAAMILGSVMDNEGAASGLGIGLSLVLAGLGGAMAPLEVFSDTMRTVAHATPHAWAYEALAQIQRHGAGLVEILPQLGALAAMALVALAIGSRTLRRSVGRAI